MSTIEITRIEDVQVGDLVTLEDRRDPSDDGTFEPDPEWRLTGHVRAIDVTHTTRDGEPYGWSVRIGHTPYMVGYLSPGGVMWAYSLVSATREVPEHEPDDVEALRLEVVKYREEAERLRAARQAPTRKRIVDAMWPEAPEGARAAMMYLPAVHRVRALFEQGDES